MDFVIDPTAPEKIVRRDFLKRLSAAGAAALMAGEPVVPKARADAPKVKHPKPTADACILLWMGGGMAADPRQRFSNPAMNPGMMDPRFRQGQQGDPRFR